MMPEPRSQQRFAELVKLHTQGRRFLDHERECRLLEDGVSRYGLTLDEARGVLRSQVEGDRVAIAGDIDQSAAHLLKTMADRKRRVSRTDFGKIVAFYRLSAGSAVSQAEAEKRVKRLMEENGFQAKRSGRLLRTRRWYRAIEA